MENVHVEQRGRAAKGNRLGVTGTPPQSCSPTVMDCDASELVVLRRDDIDFSTSKVHVRRVKGGTASVHPL
jgi:hypothetical protein